MKTKTSKKKKENNKALGFEILSLVLGILLIITICTTVCFAKKARTHEEEKRLLAFEPLIKSYVSELTMFENKENKSATVTDLGLTDDDDLYADFVIIDYENHVPVAVKKARLHFQCNESYKEYLNNPEGSNCSFAYWYGDKNEFDTAFKEKYQRYIDETTRISEETNKLIEEKGAANVENTPEMKDLHAQMQSLSDEYKEFFEEYKESIYSL